VNNNLGAGDFPRPGAAVPAVPGAPRNLLQSQQPAHLPTPPPALRLASELEVGTRRRSPPRWRRHPQPCFPMPGVPMSFPPLRGCRSCPAFTLQACGAPLHQPLPRLHSSGGWRRQLHAHRSLPVGTPGLFPGFDVVSRWGLRLNSRRFPVGCEQRVGWPCLGLGGMGRGLLGLPEKWGLKGWKKILYVAKSERDACPLCPASVFANIIKTNTYLGLIWPQV